MTAQEIFDNLLQNAIEILPTTCDGLIAGDAHKVVHKVGVCFKLTAELINVAKRDQIDMIITHEPTFSRGDTVDENANWIDQKKMQLLTDSGIALYRFHDHAHHTLPDYIHAGFLRALDLHVEQAFPVESLGVRRYRLAQKLTVRELALRIRDVLGVEFVRIVGKDDFAPDIICLGLGAVGLRQIEVLFDPGCDLFITGELGEVCVDEYVRDACYFGENKSVLVLGHYSSEYAGMRYLAEVMSRSGISTVFLDGGEVYHGV